MSSHLDHLESSQRRLQACQPLANLVSLLFRHAGCLPPLNPLRLHSPSFHTRFVIPLSSSPCLHSKWLHQNKQGQWLWFWFGQKRKSKDAKTHPYPIPFQPCVGRGEGQTYKSAFGPKARKVEFSSTSFRHDVLTHFIPHLVCAWRVSISDTGGFRAPLRRFRRAEAFISNGVYGFFLGIFDKNTHDEKRPPTAGEQWRRGQKEESIA